MDAGDGPRTVKGLLAEIKDSSELMVDLAYAAVYFGDPQMAEEVDELEDDLAQTEEGLPRFEAVLLRIDGSRAKRVDPEGVQRRDRAVHVR